jgi:hypothetical protein
MVATLIVSPMFGALSFLQVVEPTIAANHAVKHSRIDP